jgi:hypothetical protein
MRPLLSGEGAKDQASARPNRYFALSRRSLSLAKPGHPNREELCAIRKRDHRHKAGDDVELGSEDDPGSSLRSVRDDEH